MFLLYESSSGNQVDGLLLTFIRLNIKAILLQIFIDNCGSTDRYIGWTETHLILNINLEFFGNCVGKWIKRVKSIKVSDVCSRGMTVYRSLSYWCDQHSIFEMFAEIDAFWGVDAIIPGNLINKDSVVLWN